MTPKTEYMLKKPFWEMKFRKKFRKLFKLRHPLEVIRAIQDVKHDKLELEKRKDYEKLPEYKQCLNYLEILNWVIYDDSDSNNSSL